MTRTIQFYTTHPLLTTSFPKSDSAIRSPELSETIKEILLGLGYCPLTQDSGGILLVDTPQKGSTLLIKSRVTPGSQLIRKTGKRTEPVVEHTVVLKSVPTGKNWIQNCMTYKSRAEALRRFEDLLRAWIWREFSPIAFLQRKNRNEAAPVGDTEPTDNLPEPA